jgi:alpha-glucosidase
MSTLSTLTGMLLSAATLCLACNQAHQNWYAEVSSPDSSVLVKCFVSDTLEHQLQYSVWFKHKEIIRPSGLELDLQGMAPVGTGMKVLNTRTEAVNENWDRVWGKRKSVVNSYNQLVIELQETGKSKRRINFYIRAYEDGAAFRYELPVQPGLDTIVLNRDKFEFRFTGDHQVWASFWNTFHLSQEVEFTKSKLSDIKPGNIIGSPLLVNAGDVWLALLEANVTDWACSGFISETGIANAVVSLPSWLPEDTTVAVRTTSQRLSPWKVVMIADQPARFIESDLLQNLNEPCALDDVSWIRPGISAWDWWWCGSYAPDAGFKPGPDNRTMKYFIDFAAEMGWQYQLVDWQWYGPPFKEDGSFNMDADITKQIPDINIP